MDKFIDKFTLYFVIANFIVAFISDIVLNLSGFVQSLQPYFQDRTVLESAIYAGLTILIALFTTMGFSSVLFGFTVPNSNSKLVKYSILAFILGYIIDIIINRMRIFGHSLDLYYSTLGEGFWGAAAFLFSIIISYVFVKNISHLFR